MGVLVDMCGEGCELINVYVGESTFFSSVFSPVSQKSAPTPNDARISVV